MQPMMDVFPSDDLVWFVAIDPVGSLNPIVVIVGRGAQALADDEPQLASILWHIGIRQRSFQIHSRHAEALLLHMADEPAASVAHHYGLAQQTIVDLWDTETETPLVTRPLELPRRKWIHRLLRWAPSPSARRLRPWPTELVPTRFPERRGPPTAVDHARWLCVFGRYKKGRAILERYLQENPEDWEAHLALGLMLRDLAKEPLKSVPHFQRSATLAPENADVWNALGITYGSLCDYLNACAAFKREAMLTDDFGAWMNLAIMSLASGDTHTARDAASRAQRQSTDPLLLFLLTVLARREGNQADAEGLLARAERALRRMPAAKRDALATLALVKEARRSS
jgi:tetratricopeptide (TPR) repeat protein